MTDYMKKGVDWWATLDDEIKERYKKKYNTNEPSKDKIWTIYCIEELNDPDDLPIGGY